MTGGTDGTKRQMFAGVNGISSAASAAFCGAWRGAFGLEPTIEMYVDHTVESARDIGACCGLMAWSFLISVTVTRAGHPVVADRKAARKSRTTARISYRGGLGDHARPQAERLAARFRRGWRWRRRPMAGGCAL